jgi:hypothetical protein
MEDPDPLERLPTDGISSFAGREGILWEGTSWKPDRVLDGDHIRDALPFLEEFWEFCGILAKFQKTYP